MEYLIVYQLVKYLLEQAGIDIERDVWRWIHEGGDPSGEVMEGLADALVLFFETLDEQVQQEIVHAIRRFASRPTPVDLLAWQGLRIR